MIISLTIIPSKFLGFFKNGRLFENPSATICKLLLIEREETPVNATALEIILRITKNLYIFVELMMIDVMIYIEVKSCSSSFISDTFGLLLD